MDNSKNTEPFFDPDLTPDEFRKLGYQVIDQIADYYSSIRDVRVFPKSTSKEVERFLMKSFPKKASARRKLSVNGNRMFCLLPHIWDHRGISVL